MKFTHGQRLYCGMTEHPVMEAVRACATATGVNGEEIAHSVTSQEEIGTQSDISKVPLKQLSDW